MGFYGLEAVCDLNFERVDPRTLTKSQQKAVGHLIFSSHRVDYPHQSAAALRRAVIQREQSRKHLNRFVPGGVQETLQRHTAPRTIVAYDDDGQLVAYMSTTDNSSSRKGSRFPRLEIVAKERASSLLKSHFHAVGIVAVAPTRHPLSLEPFENGAVNLVDVMNYASMVGKPDEQPWAGYTWSGEKWLERAYTASGAIHKAGESSRVNDFGDGMSVRQDRWSQDAGLWLVREQIIGKAESWAAIHHVLESAGLR